MADTQKTVFSNVSPDLDRERAALLSHDIRGAVSDILGGLALADLSPLDTASQQQLVRVRSASEQLARLADEALALVTGEAGPALDLETNTRFAPLLDAIEARWAAHAAEKGMHFVLDRKADLPTAIGIDKGVLERILANVIGNAIKYAARGTVTLTVQLQSHETLAFCVTDQGPGFSEGALARLFERNGRTPDNPTPGSGLGLHIVHDLTEQINGRMSVANATDGGASVCILLPRAAWAPGIRNPVSADDLPDLTGQCVLVAEDNETNQLLVRQMLETLGAKCHMAADGLEALDLLNEHHFELALVDIEMPRLSGLDLIRTLRARDDDIARLPVLAITAYVLSANRAEIYDAGADGILAKPILSLEAFGLAIAGVLEKRQGPVPHPQPGLPDTPPEAPFSTLHLDRLLALAGSGADAELLRRLRKDFDTVREGIEHGIGANDVATLRARTHVLISLAGAIGSNGLQDRAQEMNAAAHGGDLDIVRTIGQTVLHRLGEIDQRLADEYANRFGGDGT